MKNNTFIIVIIGIVLLSGLLLLKQNPSSSSTNQDSETTNVSIVNNQQIVTITAKGGYTPAKSVVQSNLPTVIRFDTNGTFDCSASVRIASKGISKTLPSNGSLDVNIGTLQAGETVQGTCSMGMYRFEIKAAS